MFLFTFKTVSSHLEGLTNVPESHQRTAQVLKIYISVIRFALEYACTMCGILPSPKTSQTEQGEFRKERFKLYTYTCLVTKHWESWTCAHYVYRWGEISRKVFDDMQTPSHKLKYWFQHANKVVPLSIYLSVFLINELYYPRLATKYVWTFKEQS